MDKPMLTLRKARETDFVNVETFWSLTMPHRDGYLELQVKHRYPEDSFKAFYVDAASHDPIRVVTLEVFNEHVDLVMQHDEAVRTRAEAIDVLQDMRVIEAGEAEKVAHMRRTWNAFELLFSPASNLF